MSTNVIEVVLKARSELGRGLGDARVQFNGLRDSLGALNTGATQATTATRDLGEQASQTADRMTALVSNVSLLVKGFIGLQAIRVVKDLADTAARAQVLGTVLRVVGTNAGFSVDNLNKVEKSVRDMGITASAARQTLTQLIQSGLINSENSEKAAQLARASQDLAVISGQNSSETLQRVSLNIQQLDTVGLKFLGLIVDIKTAEQDYRIETGKMVGELTKQEKQQALLNAVLKESQKLSGTYEASLGDVSKQLSSLARYQEEAKRGIGEGLLPAYLALTEEFTKFLKNLNLVTDELGGQSQGAINLGNAVRTLAASVRGVVETLIEYRSVIGTLAAAYALLKVPAAFSAILSLFVSAQLRAQSLATSVALARLSLVSLGSAAPIAGISKVTSALSLLRLAAAGVTTAVLGAFTGFAIGTALREIPIVSQLATFAINLLVGSFEQLALSSELAGVTITRSMVKLFNFITRGGTESSRAMLKKLDADAEAIQFRARQISDDVSTSFAAIGSDPTESTTNLNMALKVVESLEAVSTEAKKASQKIVELRALASKGDGGAEALLVAQESKLKALEAKKKALDKELQRLRGQIAQPELDQLNVAQFDSKAVISRAEKDFKDITDALATSREKLGLNDLVLFENTTIAAEFSGGLGQIQTLIDGFLSPSLMNIDGEAKAAAASLNEVVSALRNQAGKATTADELYSVLQKIGPELLVQSARLRELRSNLSFKEGEATIKQLDEAVIGLSSRLQLAATASKNLSDLTGDQQSRFRQLQEAMLGYGQSLGSSSGSVVDLNRSLASLRDTSLQTAQIQTTASQQASNAARAEYATQLANLNLVAERKRALVVSEYPTAEIQARRLTQLEAGNLRERESLARTYYQKLQGLQSEAFDKYKASLDKVKGLDETLRSTEREGQNALRELRREGLSDAQQYADRRQEVEELASQATEATLRKDFELARELNSRRIELAKGLVNGAGVNEEDSRRIAIEATTAAYEDQEAVIKRQRAEAVKAAKEQQDTYANLTRALDELSSNLTGIASEQIVKINLEVSEDSLSAVTAQVEAIQQAMIQKAVELKLVVDLDDTSLSNVFNQLRRQFKDLSITVKADLSNARGIQSNAAGGRIRGPGTGTSDSILSWLSNGEYVVKAAAVQRYGAGYFDMLNSMALPSYDPPAFATGGMLGASPQTTRDVVDVNLNIGGKKVSLFAERSQASQLVDAISKTKA